MSSVTRTVVRESLADEARILGELFVGLLLLLGQGCYHSCRQFKPTLRVFEEFEMKKTVLYPVSIAIVCLAIGAVARGAGETETPKPTLVPVEADVHEFMEYAFEPFFKQLKSSLQSAPADKKAWVPVKANALVLAESGNLLMLRGPEENQAEWNRLAAELRDQGKMLYRSAKKRDYDLTKKDYTKFVSKCNACHETFADGEHMQKP